jgi:hypothetical protein
MEKGGQRHAPGALTPELDPVPILQKAGQDPGKSGRVRKIFFHWNSIPGPFSQ